MTSKNAGTFFNFPVSGAALDFLKIAAAVLMVVDHVDHILLERTELLLFLLGRTVFPLFCYATACYILRAGADKAGHYAARILLLAALTEPVSQIFRDAPMANVLFTLAVGGVLAAWLPAQRALLKHAVLAFFILTTPFIAEPFEFGLAGAVLPALMIMALHREKGSFAWLIAALFVINAANSFDVLMTTDNIQGFFTMLLVVGLATTLFPLMLLVLARELTDTRRLLPKYFLHVFYPGHIMVLGIIKYLFFH